jgi:hypothetical protein
VIEVIVVGEGQTEETFVRDVLAPQLTNRDISLQPRLIDTSQTGRGGALSFDRVIRFLRNTLRERSGTYVTTFFDLYGLRPDFPGYEAARDKNDPLEKSRTIEDALALAAVEVSGCRADRFVPHSTIRIRGASFFRCHHVRSGAFRMDAFRGWLAESARGSGNPRAHQ